MFRRRFQIIGLFVLLCGGARIAPADFCENVEAIVESAKEGFVGVRGELVSQHQDPLGNTRAIWQCTLALTGAQTCEVEWQRQAFTYNTFWHKQSEEANSEAFQALTELLSGCGLTRKATSKSGRRLLFVLEDETNLDVTLARNARRVRLSITTSGFPNP